MATVNELATHISMTSDGVRKLQVQGVLPRAASGNLDLDLCRLRYINHLRRERKKPAAHEYDSEKTRLASEQADREAMRNAKERGELVEIAGITNALVGIIEGCKAKLARVPAKAAPGDPKLQARIADAINDTLLDLSATRVEEQRGASIEAGEDMRDDDDDA